MILQEASWQQLKFLLAYRENSNCRIVVPVAAVAVAAIMFHVYSFVDASLN